MNTNHSKAKLNNDKFIIVNHLIAVIHYKQLHSSGKFEKKKTQQQLNPNDS